MKIWRRNLFYFFTSLFFTMACVEPVDFDFQYADTMLVVEGSITDQPGPYSVRLSKSFNLDATETSMPISGAKITLKSSLGESEEFIESEQGEYLTNGFITGKIGISYYVTIWLADGRQFESDPDMLYPAGEIKSLTYAYEARTEVKEEREIRTDVFNVFMDATASSDKDAKLRWRVTGTYKVETNPELHLIYPQDPYWLKDPRPCSGYIVTPFIPGGKLEQVAPCTCCTCWSSQYESEPLLSDQHFVANGEFNAIKLREIPITTATFYEKYLLVAEQMSLSPVAFDFFKILRIQKTAGRDLFQTTPGEITGNIKSTNSNSPVVGLFYATSIYKKSIFIDRAAVPYPLPPADLVTDECTSYYPNSSTTQPAEWR